MALIKCENCGHDVSDKAYFCPKCRYAFSKKDEKEQYWNIIYLIISFILMIGLFIALYFI